MSGPTPGSPEWLRIVTASKVAAIVGASPWQSPWSLWHEMRGLVDPAPGNDVTDRGHLLEPAVLAWWEQRHPDAYIDGTQAWFPIEDGWGGATVDLFAADDGHGNRCVVEAKTSAYDDKWGDPGTDQIPEHYAVQVQWQMLCADAPLAYVPVLFGTRLRFEEYIVQADPGVQAWLKGQARAFFESLAGDVPPDLDGHAATLATLKALHPDIDKGTAVDVTDEQIDALVAARIAKNDAAAAEASALAPVLAAMGRAQYASTPTRTRAARRQPSGRGITLKLTGDAL